VILIQGAVETVPEAITSTLKDGGRIAALFMEGQLGVCRIGHMADGRVNWRFASTPRRRSWPASSGKTRSCSEPVGSAGRKRSNHWGYIGWQCCG